MYKISIFFIFLCIVTFTQGFKVKNNKHETQSRITNGMKVNIQMFPYTAYLEIHNQDKTVRCGGAIISNTSILTAAHCIFGMKYAKVRIGSTYRTSGGQQYMTTNFKTFPKYNKTSNLDIGIVTIDEGMELDGKFADSMPVPNESRPKAGKFATVTGWGAKKEGEELSAALQMAKLKVLSENECTTSSFDNPTFCTGGEDEDVCEGDDGSPAIIDHQLYGIVSKPSCGAKNSTSLFTKTSDLATRIFIKSSTGV